MVMHMQTERQLVMGPVHERTLLTLFQHQAEARADAPAMYRRVHKQWEPITWRDYAHTARVLSAFLVDAGIKPRDHVAIWSFNRPEFVMASTATLLTGAATAPLYQTLSADEAAYILGHCAASVAVVENSELLDKVLEVQGRLPALQRIVLIDGEPAAEQRPLVMTWADAVRRGAEVLPLMEHELTARAENVHPDDVATLVYTSGTTGPPKAVMATHRNLVAAGDSLGPLVKMTSSDRVLSYLPLAHILERVNSEGRLYFAGSPLWFASSIAAMPHELREVRPTCFVGVPRVWEKMGASIRRELEELAPTRRRLAHWAIRTGERVVDVTQRGETPSLWLRARHSLADRLVLRTIRSATGLDDAHTLISGAAPISSELLRFFHALGLPILEGYGMSENMSTTSVNRHGHARLGSVGQVVPGVELRIAQDGEILMRGDVVCAGYYKDPEATAEAISDGWLHTGDIGHVDDDGFLYITDRKKDLIITAGGKNVAPSNIENALRSHLIGGAVVIGDRRPFLTALLTLDPEAVHTFATTHNLEHRIADLVRNPVLVDEVRKWVDAVNQRFANVERVRRWTLLPDEFHVGVELTPTFKVRRKVVAQRYAPEIERLYAPES